MVRIVKKPEERRQEILAMAQKLFLEKEYETTSLNDVVNALGVAKGTVYHYFKSKEALLDAVVENMSEQYLSKVRSKLKKSEASSLEKMKVLTKAMNVSSDWKSTLEDLHRSGNMGLHLRLLALTLKKMAPLFADLIEQGCKEGVFKTQYPLEAAEFFLAGFQFLTDQGIYPWKDEELKRRVQAFPNLLEQLLGAESGSLKFFK